MKFFRHREMVQVFSDAKQPRGQLGTPETRVSSCCIQLPLEQTTSDWEMWLLAPWHEILPHFAPSGNSPSTKGLSHSWNPSCCLAKMAGKVAPSPFGTAPVGTSGHAPCAKKKVVKYLIKHSQKRVVSVC